MLDFDEPAADTSHQMQARPAVAWPNERAPRARLSLAKAAVSVALLGAGVAGYVATRAPSDPDRTAVAPPARCSVDVVVTPAGADLVRHGNLIGAAPMSIPGHDNEAITLDVRKPGYLSATATGHARRAGDPAAMVSVTLTRVDSFAGAWRLPASEGAAQAPWVFARVNDEVVVTMASGDSHRMGFEPGNATSVVFAFDEEYRDPRRPTDVTCRAGAHVEFRYWPRTDRLEMRREQITMQLLAERCDVIDRTWAPAITLQRR
ncbi:MAG TPA: hypothetical protein PLF40_19070 [Kofleriaceae bacterium]|nr:hypothetical protein [Kofleriaceae bacterium]